MGVSANGVGDCPVGFDADGNGVPAALTTRNGDFAQPICTTEQTAFLYRIWSPSSTCPRALTHRRVVPSLPAPRIHTLLPSDAGPHCVQPSALPGLCTAVRDRETSSRDVASVLPHSQTQRTAVIPPPHSTFFFPSSPSGTQTAAPLQLYPSFYLHSSSVASRLPFLHPPNHPGVRQCPAP